MWVLLERKHWERKVRGQVTAPWGTSARPRPNKLLRAALRAATELLVGADSKLKGLFSTRNELSHTHIAQESVQMGFE